MSTKPNKPTPKELLKELEAIHASLLPDTATGKQSPGQAVRPSMATKRTPTSEEISTREHADMPIHTSLDVGRDLTEQQSAASMTVLPGQQSLFEESDTSNNTSSKSNTVIEDVQEHTANQLHDSPKHDADAENPFLPKHIKDRLDRERSLYQKEIDAAAKLQTSSSQSQEPEDGDALIDDLVKTYLPQIEHELRLRLKESLENGDLLSNKT